MPKHPQNNQMSICAWIVSQLFTIEETEQLQQQFPHCVKLTATTVDKDSVDIVN